MLGSAAKLRTFSAALLSADHAPAVKKGRNSTTEPPEPRGCGQVPKVEVSLGRHPPAARKTSRNYLFECMSYMHTHHVKEALRSPALSLSLSLSLPGQEKAPVQLPPPRANTYPRSAGVFAFQGYISLSLSQSLPPNSHSLSLLCSRSPSHSQSLFFFLRVIPPGP